MNRWKSSNFVLGASVCWIAVLNQTTAWGQNDENIQAPAAEVSNEGACLEILENKKDLLGVLEFQSRINAIEELRERLLDIVEWQRDSTLNYMLEQAPGIPLPDDGLFSRQAEAGEAPLDLYQEIKEKLDHDLVTDGLSAEELDVMHDAYLRALRRAGEDVGSAAHILTVGDAASRNAAFEAVMVFPLLAVHDGDWTHEHTAALPAWALDPNSLPLLRGVALYARQAFVAYQLSLYHPTDPQDPTRRGYVEFLRNTALDSSQRDDYATFIVCMNTAITIAREAGLTRNVYELTFQLAEGLGEMEHYTLAAEELNGIMNDPQLDDESYIRGLLLRLKYLYDGEQFDVIVAQLPALRDDERCEPYLPRIDYTLWVAYRRLGNVAVAQRMQTKFWEDYPDHVLGADMHFSLAMSALASGNTDEAKRALDVIRFNYPESRLIPRVIEIQERLGQ